jgi:4'-phosphopantetheinyl transferase
MPALNDARVRPGRRHADPREGARLWVVQLDRVLARPALLDDVEQERLAHLGHSPAARRFATRRTALRLLLGALLGEDPGRVALEHGANGKPRLAGRQALTFNLAHRGDTAVIAVARAGSLGVDLESMRPRVSPQRLAARFFDEREAATLATLSPPLARAAFLRCWTAKEAVLKAIGTGLTEPLSDVAVNADPREPLRLLELPDGRRAADWTLHELALVRGRLALAVAIDSPGARIAGAELLPAIRARSPRAGACGPGRPRTAVAARA